MRYSHMMPKEYSQMGVEITVCPVCKQRLAIQPYTTVGTLLVCVDCETNLRIVNMSPVKVARVDIEVTRNVDSRPEAYG